MDGSCWVEPSRIVCKPTGCSSDPPTPSQQSPGSHQDLHRFLSPPSRFQRKSGWPLEKELIHSVVLAQFPKLPFIGTTLRNKSSVCQVACAERGSAHVPPTGSNTAAFYLRCVFEPHFGWAFWRGRQLLLKRLPRRAGTWAGDSRERTLEAFARLLARQVVREASCVVGR